MKILQWGRWNVVLKKVNSWKPTLIGAGAGAGAGAGEKKTGGGQKRTGSATWS